MKRIRIAVMMVSVLLAGVATAQEERPPWLSDEVVAAAAAIELTPEQLGPFRASVTEFLVSYRDQASKLVRRGAAGLEGQIDRLRKSLARDMDERMAELLTEDQMVRYGDYRSALLDSLER
jgi:hypothetical protein